MPAAILVAKAMHNFVVFCSSFKMVIESFFNRSGIFRVPKIFPTREIIFYFMVFIAQHPLPQRRKEDGVFYHIPIPQTCASSGNGAAEPLFVIFQQFLDLLSFSNIP